MLGYFPLTTLNQTNFLPFKQKQRHEFLDSGKVEVSKSSPQETTIKLNTVLKNHYLRVQTKASKLRRVCVCVKTR